MKEIVLSPPRILLFSFAIKRTPRQILLNLSLMRR